MATFDIHLTFEEFRLKVVRQQTKFESYKRPVKCFSGTLCPDCGDHVDQHGVPSDVGCGMCSCPLTWVEAGLKSLGLPIDYPLMEALNEQR